MGDPDIRRGSRVVVARQYGPGMPDCCVSDDLLSSSVGDAVDVGTVVSVETVNNAVLQGREFVWSEVAVACVIFDGSTEDQYQPANDGMPLLTAWRIPVACLQEVPDERVAALEAEVARLRAESADLWSAVNGFIDEEECPACGDGPEPVRRWLHDGDRVDCVCGHEGRVSACSESMPYLEWDEVSDG